MQSIMRVQQPRVRVCQDSETKSTQDSQDGVALAVAFRLVLVAVDRVVGAAIKNDGLVRLCSDIKADGAGLRNPRPDPPHARLRTQRTDRGQIRPRRTPGTLDHPSHPAMTRTQPDGESPRAPEDQTPSNVEVRTKHLRLRHDLPTDGGRERSMRHRQAKPVRGSRLMRQPRRRGSPRFWLGFSVGFTPLLLFWLLAAGAKIWPIRLSRPLAPLGCWVLSALACTSAA